jgi:hypothetical protein
METAIIDSAYLDVFDDSDITLEVHFCNGQGIRMPFVKRVSGSEYRNILLDEDADCPKTDGRSVYWEKGPRFSCEEIMAMVEGAAL